ncbi:uncharacterized protein LOC126767040 [Bactrocera neohumeralis]|uniref:uncharacterized protein LOC126767040 n=1 Tax=Bactrocera neohumeralis TaxID=98809 RepID=UPI002166BCD4|nr:uncharacterized protein LOC126767040 [Bactrocera neohumeralis]
MSCRCILCKREVSAGKQPTHQVHWTPRNPDEDIQRQRHQFRRRRSQAARIEGGVSGNGSRTEEIRSRRRVQLHLYTTAGAALRRIMGSRGEVRQTPHRSGNRQRATHSRGVSNSVGRSGGHPQLSPPSTSEPRSQRRRGVNTSASINRMLPAGITPEKVPVDPVRCCERWQLVCCLKQQFWRQWSKVYLTGLQERNKWLHPKRNMQLNDLVLVHEDNVPPQQWVLGRVVATVEGQDGKVRVAEVATKTGTIKRPIHKLAVLPLDIEGI